MKRTSILALGMGILLSVGLFAPGCGDDDEKVVKRDAGAEVGIDGPRGTGGTPGIDGPKGTGGTPGTVEAGQEAGPKLDGAVETKGSEALPMPTDVGVDVGTIDVPAVIDMAGDLVDAPQTPDTAAVEVQIDSSID